MHLKVIQQMSKLPRSISAPMFGQGFSSNSGALRSVQTAGPLPSSMIESSSVIGSTQSRIEPTGVVAGRSTLSFLNLSGAQDGGINLLAGMGLTDDQYTLILQNMLDGESMIDDVAASTEKRTLEDMSEDGRSRKRSRFKTIE